MSFVSGASHFASVDFVGKASVVVAVRDKSLGGAPAQIDELGQRAAHSERSVYLPLGGPFAELLVMASENAAYAAEEMGCPARAG